MKRKKHFKLVRAHNRFMLKSSRRLMSDAKRMNRGMFRMGMHAQGAKSMGNYMSGMPTL